MPLDDYFSGLERARKIIDTNEIELQKVMLLGLDLVKDGEGLYDTTQLAKKRSEIIDVISIKLADGAQAHFKVSAETMGDPFKRDDLIRAYRGVDLGTINKIVTKLLTTPNLNPANLGDFLKVSGKYTRGFYTAKGAVALNFLKPSDAGEVINYVDPTDQYKLDPGNDIFKEVEVLAEMANQFRQYGVLIPRYVQARPQIFEKAVKKSNGIATPPGLLGVVGGRAQPAAQI